MHATNKDERDKYVLHKRTVIREMPEFNKVCMNFHFKLVPAGQETDTLIFTRIDRIFELNFFTDVVKDIRKFDTPFERQPLYFQPNKDQTFFVTASPDEGK